MNKNIDIDTEKLKIAINKQKSINEKMSQLFEKIKKNNELLKDSWNTKTSEIVFEDFNNLYKVFEKINNTNSYYNNFLENIVSSNYIFADSTIDKNIDSRISIE